MTVENESLVSFKCNGCGSVFQTRKADGSKNLTCPHCDGEMYPRAIHGEDAINSYARYRCVSCNHIDRVASRKQDYVEVMPCPTCSGFFVDEWAVGKYKLPELIKE